MGKKVENKESEGIEIMETTMMNVLTNEVEINTVKILKQKRIVHLITDENAYKKQTEIGDFIKKNYKKELIINKITIWKLL